MKIRIARTLLLFACAVFLLRGPLRGEAQPLPIEGIDDLQVIRGPINGVLLERNGHRLAIYGDPRKEFAQVDTVLFTHHRRDVVWAGRSLVQHGAASDRAPR